LGEVKSKCANGGGGRICANVQMGEGVEYEQMCKWGRG